MDRPRRPRFVVAAVIYALATLVFAVTTARDRFAAHTPYNHFALLADAWLHGRLDLGGPPPDYTGGNDFAVFHDRYYVSFPPFPAVLIAPLVKLAGGAAKTRDGLFFLALAGLAPAALFLALDKLSATGRSRRTLAENALLALLFAFGTVYWFTAVQGTVWFAAHVVGAALAAAYLYCCIGAAHPFGAGLALALGFATRTPLGFAFPLFVYEAYRASTRDDAPDSLSRTPRIGRADARALFDRLLLFALPAAAVVAVLFWHNRARFGDPFEFGHRLLAIGWRGRIDRWGLFSYHYLAKNLAVVLTSLPFTQVPGTPFQINGHGLALWVTSPFYLWVLWPRLDGEAKGLFAALAVTAAAVAVPSLFYQNSGWIQFGYRFSNDFAPFLFAMIAVGAPRLRAPFWVLGVVSLVVNGFGAVSFQRTGFERFYFIDPTQKVLHQPD